MDYKSFCEKAKKVHGERYDYSKVVIGPSRDKIIIICSEHGEFQQIRGNHFKGTGCPACGRLTIDSKRTVSNEVFIKRSQEVYGDTLDYSLTEYKTMHLPVKFRCKDYDVIFQQTGSNHLKGGNGCSVCVSLQMSKSKALTQDAFISKSKEIFGDKFNYTEVSYTDYETPVSLRCNTCEIFYSTLPSYHLRTSLGGCKSCLSKLISQTHTTNDFEWMKGKARKLHGSKYDYSQVDYVKATEKVKIRCTLHNSIFWQTPAKHVEHDGCTQCVAAKLPGYLNEDLLRKKPEMTNIPYTLYHIELHNPDTKEHFHKIGLTKTSIEKRCRGFLPYKLKRVIRINEGPLKEMLFLEQLILETIKNERRNYYPQIRVAGHTEFFIPKGNKMKENTNTGEALCHP